MLRHNKLQDMIKVLILVLMEDTLRDDRGVRMVNYPSVLILVLMEDTLRVNAMKAADNAADLS